MPANDSERPESDAGAARTAPQQGRLTRWLTVGWLGRSAIGSGPEQNRPSPQSAHGAGSRADTAVTPDGKSDATSAADDTDPTGPAVTGRRPSRGGEATRLWFRSDRVFHENGGWYISTREGIDVGPYQSAGIAHKEAKRLIELLAHSAENGVQDLALTIQQFMDRPKTR